MTFRTKALATTLVVAATALVVGCSTPGDLMVRQPSFTVDSTKDSKATAGCIADRLSAKYHRMGSTVSSRVTATGYVVLQESPSPFGTAAAMLIEINDAPNGTSRVTGRFAPDIRGYALADAEDAARGCSR